MKSLEEENEITKSNGKSIIFTSNILSSIYSLTIDNLESFNKCICNSSVIVNNTEQYVGICDNSNQITKDHFVQTAVMVNIGSNAKRKLNDYKLSRYACYLIVQNADSRKETVALGQTYFAIQTRKQELTELEYALISPEPPNLIPPK